MLMPEYLQGIPDAMVELYAQAEADILADMARRINGFDLFIPSAQYQMHVLEEMGELRSAIINELSRVSKKSRKELAAIMREAGMKTLEADEAAYQAAGLAASPAKASPAVQKALSAGLKKTNGLFTNLTRTTANTATKQFERALDRAYMQISSGAISQDAAVSGAIKGLAKDGVGSITYSSGHVDSLEVAVRRATVTGVNQTCLKMQEARADELGVDLVETTAHAGARPSHAEWQGQIFSRSGRSLKYPDFVSSTGYGTGAGLGGWNCSHSFRPYIEGMPRTYSRDLLDSYQAKDYTYNGQKLTEYEALQQQRYIERNIRRWKRENIAMKAAGKDTAESAAKISQWQAAQKDFLAQTGLKRQSSREQIAGWGRSQASGAAAKAQQVYQTWSKEIGVNASIKTLAKYYDVKYTDSPRYALLRQYTKDVQSGWISPLAGFAQYEECHRQIQERIVGKTTAGGTVISGQSAHFMQRVLGTMKDPEKGRSRSGVNIEDIEDALFTPKRIAAPVVRPDGLRSVKYTGACCDVAINPDTGNLIQTNPRRER